MAVDQSQSRRSAAVKTLYHSQIQAEFLDLDADVASLLKELQEAIAQASMLNPTAE